MMSLINTSSFIDISFSKPNFNFFDTCIWASLLTAVVYSFLL